jgi:hypothetical protein
VIIDGVWFGNLIYWTPKHTTRDYTLQITITYRLVLSVSLHCHCLVAASNGGSSPSSAFPNCPRPQLLASHCNSRHKSYFTTGDVPPISLLLAPSPLRLTRGFIFLQLNPCGHSSYVTFSLTSEWVCLLWTGFACVKFTCCTYSMLLKILPFTLHTIALSVQALQSRSCLPYVSYATTAA